MVAQESPEASGWRLFRKAASQTTQDSNVSQLPRHRGHPLRSPPPWVSASGSGCPVVGSPSPNGMPSSSNSPQPGQSKPLSTWRQASSIPAGGEAPLPEHQPAHGVRSGVWTYPSEQMFYNAMRRKGWTPSEEDMTAVVAIHNAVNERAWREVRAWEAAAGCPAPTLLRFRGRPADVSPKARLLNALGYRLPFDRHDWVVERGGGREVRYVIDFYNGAPSPDMPTAMHLDVRPALDSPLALWERLRMQAGWVASGRWQRE
ncbi:hypothetical protein APUTEX25_005523 [Auxenochlorella protothecoides]|uniref:Holocytochrome c-type synthase n=1 Tax=Auxenochlorella protothecoides TaxID=3075 RepID=A0A3M7KZQ7_AUXPR|nr:hypothetical protein APUTEX25_005523 [Auxenochlorella protothecoides]|eukprot:RMZ55245.1 hypothetical protein APUTEX25_005523 [Auxenochlorella protothecoides]